MTDKKKPYQGDAERAAAGSRYRRGESVSDGSPAAELQEEDSMAVIVGEDDTPIESPSAGGRRRSRKTVQQFADDTKSEIRTLRQEIKELQAEISEINLDHTNRAITTTTRIAVAETQIKTFFDMGESVDALQALAAVQRDLIALRTELLGASGTNGKIGTLRADMDRATEEIRSDVWGDEKRKEGDPPVIKEARRGIWILRGLVALLIGAAGTAGYIVKDAVHQDGEVETQILDDRAEIRSLQQQVQLLYSKLVISGVSK